MKQEDKELLIKDLCMRLPYNVYVDRIGIPHKLIGVNSADKTVTINNKDYMPTTFFINASEIPVKPYLRPMSSMTEEEKKEWFKYSNVDYDCEFKPDATLSVYDCHLSIDWLNEHHFDYRGLIEKGLALEAPEGMYENN